MMEFRFSEYSRDELVRCGKAFADAAQTFAGSRPKASTTEWTEFILDSFACAAAKNITIDARAPRGGIGPLSEGLARRSCKGEFMLDMAHTTYPGYERGDFATRSYWVRAMKGSCQLRLALESELGRYRNSDESFAMVLDDAAKLAAVRSDVKVMVFATQDGREAIDFKDALTQLREQSQDAVPWLWVDLPWDPGMDGAWKPSHGILG